MNKKVLVIAEIGHNANGNMMLNKLMIEEAKRCGADIAKFQVYDIEKIWKPWQARYMELKAAQPSKEDVKELADYCNKIGIEFMASAFDAERVEWLEEVGVKRHKLASRSIYDKETIKAMEKTGKPIIASLGMTDERGIPKIKKAEYLYCVAEYPAFVKDIPLNFGEGDFRYQGFSDHTIGMEWAKEAVKRGATIIEKHFTLDHTLPGFNQQLSANPQELEDFITWARNYERQN